MYDLRGKQGGGEERTGKEEGRELGMACTANERKYRANFSSPYQAATTICKKERKKERKKKCDDILIGGVGC